VENSGVYTVVSFAFLTLPAFFHFTLFKLHFCRRIFSRYAYVLSIVLCSGYIIAVYTVSCGCFKEQSQSNVGSSWAVADCSLYCLCYAGYCVDFWVSLQGQWKYEFSLWFVGVDFHYRTLSKRDLTNPNLCKNITSIISCQ